MKIQQFTKKETRNESCNNQPINKNITDKKYNLTTNIMPL